MLSAVTFKSMEYAVCADEFSCYRNWCRFFLVFLKHSPAYNASPAPQRKYNNSTKAGQGNFGNVFRVFFVCNEVTFFFFFSSTFFIHLSH